MATEQQNILEDRRMTSRQIVVVSLCVVLYALDGFDVLAISFSAPGIAEEWSISRGELGIVLAMELVGMSVGSVLLGMFADKWGRRPITIGCLLVMSMGMYLASTAKDVNTLLIIRFITGLGIGGMLATTTALVAEYSNARHRSFNVAVMATGYPIGIVVGGSIASVLLTYYDWRSVFLLGAIMTVSLLPLVWFLIPESISYLNDKRGPNALQKINAILSQLGHSTLEILPDAEKEIVGSGWKDLFSPQLARTTIILTLAYSAHILTFYFILKWIPKIVVDMDYSAALAGGVLVWANVGGALGSVLLGWLTHHYRVRLLVIVAMVGSVVMINVFGMGQADLTQLAIVAGIAGFFTNSAVVGLYALLADSFPTHLRASGTGFVIGFGRAGAVMGPIMAGLLFDGGSSLAAVSFVMALGSLVAACLVFLLGTTKATSL